MITKQWIPRGDKPFRGAGTQELYTQSLAGRTCKAARDDQLQLNEYLQAQSDQQVSCMYTSAAGNCSQERQCIFGYQFETVNIPNRFQYIIKLISLKGKKKESWCCEIIHTPQENSVTRSCIPWLPSHLTAADNSHPSIWNFVRGLVEAPLIQALGRQSREDL